MARARCTTFTAWTKAASPTFDKVMRGLRLLQKHGVDYNVLTTVNRQNGDHPLEVYRFLRDEVGKTWMQFIPVVERINADGLHAPATGQHRDSDRSVRPEQFGRFLSTIFDEWVRNDVGRIYVQTIEAALSNWLACPPACASSTRPAAQGWPSSTTATSTRAITLSSRTILLGNIQDTHMIELVSLAAAVRSARTSATRCRATAASATCASPATASAPRTASSIRPMASRVSTICAPASSTSSTTLTYPMQIMAGLMRRGRERAGVMQILAGEEAKWAALFENRATSPAPAVAVSSSSNAMGNRQPVQPYPRRADLRPCTELTSQP
jgi:uncharacterized protein